MRLCPECLGAGSFEVFQERRREHCVICNGDGELPDCPRCGEPIKFNEAAGSFTCPCGEDG